MILKLGGKSEGATTRLYLLANMGINSAEWIIEDKYILVGIESPCNGHSLLLTSTQIDSSLPNFCLVSRWKLSKIRPIVVNSNWINEMNNNQQQQQQQQ